MRIKSKGRIAAILAVLIAVMVALLCFGFGRTALQASAAETNLYNIRFDYTAYRGIYISTATVVQASGTNVLESEEIQSTKNANNKLKLAFQIYGTSYSSPANLSNGGYIGSNTVNIATNSTFSKHTFEIKNIGKMERIGLMPSRCIVPVKLWRKNDQRGRAAKK